MKKILVPVDFSDVTDLVVENAKLFAKSFDAELKIIHAVYPLPKKVQAAEGPGEIFIEPLNYEYIRDELAVEIKNEHKKLLEIKKKLTNEKIKAKVSIIGGKISDAILSQVKEYAPDLIVMGSHGHGYMMKALLGSVAVSVIKNVKCPVIIVPSKAKK